MKMTFRLYANCLPVRGARRSVLCDVQRQRYSFIPNQLYTILVDLRGRTVDEIKAVYAHSHNSVIDSYFEFLLSNGYGFYSDEPGVFPELDLSWAHPAVITNAIVDVDAGSCHDYAALFKELHAFRCYALQLRMFTRVAMDDLCKILDETNATSLRSIDLLLQHSGEFEEDRLSELCTRYQTIDQIALWSSPCERLTVLKPLGVRVIFHRGHINSGCCGQVHPAYFSVNIAHFTEALHHNSCLNRKISICADGDIRVCPSIPPSLGNIKTTTLGAVLGDERLMALWGITKDAVEVCRDCEFRYICTDCRAYTVGSSPTGKPKKCSYDPYTAKWESPPRSDSALRLHAIESGSTQLRSV